MKLYQWAELLGIMLIMVSTAAQIFLVEPAKRNLEFLVVGSFVSTAERNLSAELARNFRSLAVRDGVPEGEADALVKGLTGISKEAGRVARYRSDTGRATQLTENIFSFAAFVIFVLGTVLTVVGRYAEMRAKAH
ncbi:MAG: hypothetical protein AAFQ35_15130 [Pseudomonadota bacterium]